VLRCGLDQALWKGAYNVKYLRIVFGLATATGLMAVMAAPAMATQVWVQCEENKEQGQWETSSCTKAKTDGNWETEELVETVEVTSSDSLELEDSKATGGAIDVKCSGKNMGWLGAEGTDGISAMTISCSFVKHGECEESKGISAKAVNLPWATRLEEKAGHTRDVIENGGTGEPGWSFECLVGGILKVADTCERSGVTTSVSPNSAQETIETSFDKVTEEEKMAKCSSGGAESGLIRGTEIISPREGGAISTGAKAPFPVWYSEGVRITGNTEATGVTVKTGSGTGTIGFLSIATTKNAVCKMEDAGKIWNPAGRAGQGTITSATFSGCTSIYCLAGENPGLEATSLPWNAELVGSPPKLAIRRMGLRVLCNGAGTLFSGEIKPRVRNGNGVGEAACQEKVFTTFLELRLNFLSAAGGFGEFSAASKDCIWGNAANEKITAVNP
jgi:hypothetical protein